MNIAAIALLLAGALLAGLLAAFAFYAPLEEVVEDAQRIWARISSVGLVAVLGLLGLWRAAPDFTKQLIARAIRLAPDAPNYLKRRAIKNEIESAINRAFKQFHREGFVDHEIVVSWLKPGESAREVFFRSGKAYLKLDYSNSQETNLAEAALRFCRQGLLPETRQYVPRPLMRAIDLQFVDEVLQRQRAGQSRGYFLHEVMRRETAGSAETARFVDKLQMVSQHGLFTRVLLPELRDYPALVNAPRTHRGHAQEIESFLDFLEATVKSREEGTKTALIHVGLAIRTAIVLVGIPSKLEFEGTRPYVRRAAINERQGAQTVYFLGYNIGINYIERIAKETAFRGLADHYEFDLYDAAVRETISRYKLARLTMRHGAGSQFIAEHPSTDEWPDIEDDVEWQAILAEVTAERVSLKPDSNEDGN